MVFCGNGFKLWSLVVEYKVIKSLIYNMKN